jgi:predicted metalloprotease
MRTVRLVLALLLAALCLAGVQGCGGDHPVRDLRERAERARDRLEKKVKEVLDDLRQAVPEATPQTRAPATRGRTEADEVSRFLDVVLASIDRYWTRTLTAAGRPEPRVSYLWVPPGEIVRTGCGVAADDSAAFYCSGDDTIYVSVVLAARLWRGIARDFPGERAGYGHAVGDFGLAYVVAHEYAHNVQSELGLYTLDPRFGVEPFELQADCMAGLWGNSVYREGRLQPGDVEEAMSTAAAAGDFDYANAQHHGTPAERRQAWLTGYRTGDPQACARYVPT